MRRGLLTFGGGLFTQFSVSTVAQEPREMTTTKCTQPLRNSVQWDLLKAINVQ